MKELCPDILKRFSTLIIELTNYCNLNCSMCYIQRKHRGWMKIDLFKKIIDELYYKNVSANMFLPFWKGESLLHPQFDDMIQYYIYKNKDYKIASNAGIDTNGLLLDQKKSELFLSSEQFSVITFSVDAFSKETYKKIRGGNRDVLYNNIKEFLKERIKINKKPPAVVLQYIIMQDNIKEVDLFIDHWKSFFCEHNIKYNINWDYDKPGPVKDVTILFRPVILPFKDRQEKENRLWKDFIKRSFNFEHKEKKNFICGGPFTHLAFNFKGEVFPCCVDTKDTLIIGDVNKESITEIVNGDKLKKIKDLHLSGKKDEIVQCRDCPGQVYPTLKKEWFL